MTRGGTQGEQSGVVARIAAIVRLLPAGILVCACLAFVLLAFVFSPAMFGDWMNCFRPAALNWRDPYEESLWPLFNPPWLFLILHPLSLLPPRVGAATFMLCSFAAVAVYVRSPLKTFLVGVSAPMVVLFTLGQVDALPLVGLVIPGGFGIPFLMLKPQGIYLTALRRINLKSMSITLLVLVLATAIWGPWWQHLVGGTRAATFPHNRSLFPYSAIVGFVPLYFGIKRQSDVLLCVASLCFSPYYQITSLLPVVAAVARATSDYRLILATVAGSWAYWWLA